jgi:hypothetical protein
MNFLNLIATFFQRENGEVSSNDDSTRYRIVTGTSEYLGTIIHQDGVVIKLKSEKSKPVKILKTNISSISIVNAHPNKWTAE